MTLRVRGRPSALLVEIASGGEAPRESEVAIGGRSVDELAVPRFPLEDGEPWGEDAEPPVVDVSEPDRGRLEVAVASEGRNPGVRVRIHAIRYPPSDPPRPLGVDLDSGARLLSESGFPDAVVIEGPAPLRVAFPDARGARLALAVEIDGRQVHAEAMRYLGRGFAAGRLGLYLPAWFPGRSDWFLR